MDNFVVEVGKMSKGFIVVILISRMKDILERNVLESR